MFGTKKMNPECNHRITLRLIQPATALCSIQYTVHITRKGWRAFHTHYFMQVRVLLTEISTAYTDRT